MNTRYLALMVLLLHFSILPTKAQQNIFREYKSLEANNLQAWFSNDARNFQTREDAAGLIYPTRSGRSAIFMAGAWVAARFNGDTSVTALRTAALQNIGPRGTEYMPGKIIVVGEDSLRSVFSATKHRLYHLRRGDNAQTNPDFRDFPIDDGAPFDAFGNPRIIGGETMWYTANDVAGFRRFTLKPLGCELQQTMYAIPSDNPVLDNTIFIRKRFINRNPSIASKPNSGLWKEAYFGFFSDTDLGEASDDLGGSDSLNKMIFAYNATENDPVYGSPPPAVGIIFLEGKHNQQPIDIYAMSRGFKSGPMGDPLPIPSSPIEIYNLLRGLNRNGQPAPFTETGSRIMFPGDPETGVGILDTLAMDIRHWMSVGPVDVAPGDTVELLYAVTVARGVNRRNSVTLLKNYAHALRQMHSNTLPPTKLWLYVNRGNDLTSGASFPIVVEARDENGFPRRVSQPTTVSVQLARGDGNLTGTLTGIILPGQNSVTLNANYITSSNTDTVVFRAVRLSGNMLLSSNSNAIPVRQRASRLVLNTLISETSTRITALDTLQLKINAARADGTIDRSYFGQLRLSQIDGSGFIAGDSVSMAFSGEATFRIVFRQGGWSKLRVSADDLQAFVSDTIRIERPLVILKYPQYFLQSELFTFPALLRLNGLLPNSTYRYRVTTSRNTSTMIVPNEVSFGRISQPFAPNLATQFGLFRTDSQGSYTGWFIVEMRERAFFKVTVNDGKNGTEFVLPTADVERVAPTLILNGLRTNTTIPALRATSVVGVLPFKLDTMETRCKIAVLYGTTDSTAQQPLTAAIIENDSLDAATLPLFYQNAVNARNGRFGAIIPALFINEIRRVEIYDLQGRLRASAISPDGLWNGGATMGSDGIYQLLLTPSQFNIHALPNNAPQPQPISFELGQNYPNPFNPTTTIPIQIPRTERVVLKVFDVLGREVATLIDGTLSANEYLIPFHAANLSSGVYFYRLQSGEFVRTKKMILLK
jgi:hypothetical protein